MNTKHTFNLLRSGLLPFSFCLSVLAQAQVPITPVAIGLEPAPGGGLYNAFSLPTISASGQIAFRASQVANFPPPAIFNGMPGTFQPRVRVNDPAPGVGPDVYFSSFGEPLLNEAGEFAFAGALASFLNPGLGATNNTGYWGSGSGALSLVAREGDQAAGVADAAYFWEFNYPPSFNSAGQIAFAQDLIGPEITSANAYGYWLAGTNGLQLLIRISSNAPGIGPQPGQLTSLSPQVGALPLNNRGEVTFRGSFTGPQVNWTNNEAVWVGTVGALRLAVREGTAYSDLTFGSPIQNTDAFRDPVINDLGSVLFAGFLVGTNVYETNDTALCLSRLGVAPRAVVREGEAAPGTPEGVFFGSFMQGFFAPGAYVLGAGDRFAFFNFELTGTGVDGGNDEGLWTGDTNSLHLVAREGEHAPGTPAGVNYGSLRPSNFGGDLIMNRSGHLAFQARLTGLGVDGGNDLGLWVALSGGDPMLVARTGQEWSFNGNPHVLKSFDLHWGSGGEDGRPSVFSADGRLIFTAVFTDDTTGVFLANVESGRPVITEITRVGNDIRLEFTTISGRDYRVWYAETLPSWGLLPELYPGSGGTISVTNFAAGNLPQRFYRVERLP